MTKRPIYKIAEDIYETWSKLGKGINYAAKPYLQAMFSLTNIDSTYGYDSADDIIRYFLCNATTFRGERAKTLKAELKAYLDV